MAKCGFTNGITTEIMKLSAHTDRLTLARMQLALTIQELDVQLYNAGWNMAALHAHEKEVEDALIELVSEVAFRDFAEEEGIYYAEEDTDDEELDWIEEHFDASGICA